MTVPLELSRPFAVARIGTGARVVVEAKPEECRALADRLGLEAVHRLVCRFDLERAVGDSIAAAGLLEAKVRQTCVASLEPFDADVTENFVIRFVPAGTESAELDLEDDDEIPYERATLELGEAASQQLALALDPFPRQSARVLF